MKVRVKKLLKIGLTIGITILCGIVLSSVALAQSPSNVLAGGVLPQGTNYAPFTYRMWIATRSGDMGTGNGIYTGTNWSVYFHDAGNFSPTWVDSEEVIACVDREVNGGTVNHIGYYAVTNVLSPDGPFLKSPPPLAGQNFSDVTMRPIPRPSISAINGGGEAILEWSEAIDDGSGSNIIGYNLYKSLDGINFSPTPLNGLTPVLYGTTTYTDTSYTEGDIYTIKLVYRRLPDTVESEYFSRNSVFGLSSGHNYPNPFDPLVESTWIVVGVSTPTKVETYIYDITARLVWKDKRVLNPGEEIEWDGKTYYNKVTDNGIYLLRVVRAKDKKLIGKGKILVIKR